jgi:glycerol-1-phosphate dehydrogenase [NAD(P)+]
MSALPAFAFDPADMEGLRARLEDLPSSAAFPDHELRRAEFGDDALLRLPQALEDLTGSRGPVILVQGSTPMSRAGEDLKPLVRRLLDDSGWKVETIVLPVGDDGETHADEQTVEYVLSRLRDSVPVVSLGSGTVTDVTKHACFTFGLDHGPLSLVFCATANSVPAYTAQMSVISRAGVKRTRPSRLSDVLIHDTQVLRDAPPHTIAAGIGDISAMFVSFGDWSLAHQLGLGKFDQAPVDLVADVRETLLPYAREMRLRTAVGVDVLSRLLALSGLAVTLAGESAPLSGYEHVTVHMLDMAAGHFGRGVGTHGSQVGMAVMPCSVSWTILLDEFDPAAVDVDGCYPSFETMESVVGAAFEPIDPSGRMADECWRDYRAKLSRWHDARPAFESLLADWVDQRVRLRELVGPFEQYVSLLRDAGLPLRWEELPVAVPEAEARWAFANAHLMRQRFTHADLLYYLGWFDEPFIDRVFSRVRDFDVPLRPTDNPV